MPDKTIQITADPDLTPLRIDLFLSQNLDDISRSLAGKIIAKELCLLNSQIVKKASTIVHAGDLIELRVPKEEGPSLEPEDLDLNVVFEDDDIIVVNKEFGRVVHPSAGHPRHTLVNGLLFHCKKLSMGFHEHRPGIVHRLDKDTGGLLVVAKNQKAHTHLAEQFKNKSAGRIYTAACFNKFKDLKGSFESYLSRHPKNRLKFASTLQTKTGKWAKTHYKVLNNSSISIVELSLETGRTHQIRVHLSENNNSIINDELYSHANFLNQITETRLKSIVKNAGHMFLFAHTLELNHPVSQERLSFKAKLPKSFSDLIEFLNES